MEIRQLEYFYAISNTGSFTRAAENLHVAQPSITKAIHQLEAELGIILFDRSQKKNALTAEGQAFFIRAEKILREANEAVAEMNDFKNLQKGTIKIAIPPMIGAYLFPNIFTGFRKQYPSLELLVFEEGSLAARTMLEREELDLGLVILPETSHVLQMVPMIQEEIMLCVSSRHRFAGKTSVSFEELRNEQFVMLKEDSYHRQLVIEECNKFGFSPRIVFSSSQIQTIKGLVASGVGISFLFSMAARDNNRICLIPLEKSLRISIGLAWKKDKYLSKASQTLIEFIMEYSRSPHYEAVTIE